MAEIRPFRGLRYNPAVVSPDDVIAPPYDVVGEAAEARLLARSPYNAAHVELAPGAVEGRFDRAAAALASWQANGQLVRDDTTGYYLYEQIATIEGERVSRRCFFAQLRLAQTEEGIVRPHESTMAGPRAIRLDLMRATNADISPIFSMFTDPARRAQPVLDRAASGAPAFEATDELGDVHRLWPISDAAEVATLTEVLRDSTVTIADGHHRYHTALDYAAENPASGPARYVLMGLIDADDPGLVILPIHRLVRTAPPADFLERLGERVEVTDLTAELAGGAEGAAGLSEGAAAAAGLLARVRGHAGGPSTFGVIEASGRLLLAVGRSFEALGAGMPAGLSEASRRLDALVLTTLVLDPIFGIDAAALTAGAVTFTEDANEAYRETVEGPYSVAFLVNGTPVRQVIEVADAGEVMPQKTTFFYPKLATGMVFSLLDE
ncbi:MAG: DUF1015 domain-containing protein [Chloroflexi bacterium]|nr:DUF1015 domain-containing protein [Chloroflexota bacterium]